MAQINKPTEYFNTKLYTGNASTQSITGINFQSDMVWTKARSGTYGTQDHAIIDVVRGVTKTIRPNQTTAEGTETNTITSFDTDGYTIGGDNGKFNQSSTEYVSWNWLADNTSGSSNTDGSITSTVSANTTSGFSIVSYTATSGMSSIGHGLGVTPSVIILKTRDQSASFFVGNASLGWDKIMFLNLTNASSTDDRVFSPSAGSDPTSSVFFSDQSGIGSAGTMIAYCFAEKKGFSKFGSYTGNGSTDGTFVYTGFKPAFVIVKRTSASGTNWQLIDNKRSDAGGNNVIDKVISPNASDAEYDEGSANWFADFVSNGFKIRNSFSASNSSGATYIYMCFAENPLVSSAGVPCTAR